jgi:hypothetical protein
VAKNNASPARHEAAVLDARGPSPRDYKNTLAFLATDATRLEEVRQGMRQFLAWRSLRDDHAAQNLDQFQTRQADTKRRTADDAAEARIPETHHWLLVRGRRTPGGRGVGGDPPEG